MSAGANCAETETGKTRELTLDELIDFLEPQIERECVPVQGMPICSSQKPDKDHPLVKLPARAGAMIISSDDYELTQNELEEACRELGMRCSKKFKMAIVRLWNAEYRVARTKNEFH
jgi:hypothetical protein